MPFDNISTNTLFMKSFKPCCQDEINFKHILHKDYEPLEIVSGINSRYFIFSQIVFV
jgi:hypothetical protein